MRNPYQVEDTREVYRNPWIRVREDRILHPDGTPGLFAVVEGKPGSAVLAVTEDNEVHLVREYKYGVGRPSLELVCGGIEPGESPLDAARRELKEEVGLTADTWEDLGAVDPFTTVVASPNYIFIARGLRQGVAEPDPSEVLECRRVPFRQAVEMVLNGEITHATSCVAILKAHVTGRIR